MLYYFSDFILIRWVLNKPGKFPTLKIILTAVQMSHLVVKNVVLEHIRITLNFTNFIASKLWLHNFLSSEICDCFVQVNLVFVSYSVILLPTTHEIGCDVNFFRFDSYQLVNSTNMRLSVWNHILKSSWPNRKIFELIFEFRLFRIVDAKLLLSKFLKLNIRTNQPFIFHFLKKIRHLISQKVLC